jgi:hypothetical protein
MHSERDAVDLYVVEYEQAMESYRVTYLTIWQAGAVFVTASAVIVAFAASSSGGINPVAQVIAPIPFLFWWWGIFRPMHRYGEMKSRRLQELEAILSEKVVGLEMRHFREYHTARNERSSLSRVARFQWLWQPRVSEVVDVFGFVLLALEAYLVWVHYLA